MALHVLGYATYRGVARISRRGGSKLVPTKTVGLKIQDFGVYAM